MQVGEISVRVRVRKEGRGMLDRPPFRSGHRDWHTLVCAPIQASARRRRGFRLLLRRLRPRSKDE
eukprot:3349107-Rhodomonas_salina.1